MNKAALWVLFFASVTALNSSCVKTTAELGTADNPVKLFFVPSVDAKTLTAQGKVVQDYLEKATPYKFKTSVPSSYVAVVEAFGTSRADIAAINTFGYILAHDKYGVEAKLLFVRFGDETYKSQIVARADSKIKKLEDLQGKKFAFVDPSSTSGYLLPAKLLKDRGIKPSETVFASKHDNVITMVYQKQVDAGATFHTPAHEGKIQDARRLVLTQFPDIEKQVSIIELTDAIPNDPIAFRKGMPEEMKTNITQALLEFMKTEQGQAAFKALYDVTEMRPTTDARYDSVRTMLKDLGKTANDMMKK